MTFKFNSLPPEVRQLVWEASLPGRRVFHLSSFLCPSHTKQHPNNIPALDGAGSYPQTCDVHIRHSPPAATQVCCESRNAALRRGFFLSACDVTSTGPRPGVWFNPHQDMLYFDRNMRRFISVKHHMNITDIDRVLHIGVEWRAWFRDVPLAHPKDDVSLLWKPTMEVLLYYFPRAKSLNFILPKVRKNGTMPIGREPYSAKHYPCDIEPLDDSATVPWERETRLPVSSASFRSLAWSAIRKEMGAALHLLQGSDMGAMADEHAGREAQQKGNAPTIEGWWLIRPEVKRDFGEEEPLS